MLTNIYHPGIKSRARGLKILWMTHYKTKYKTRLCTNFEETNHCPFLGRCTFAHGLSELVVEIKIKRIEQPCPDYHLQGACMNGFRCQYLHDEVKLLNKENLAKFVPNELHEYFG